MNQIEIINPHKITPARKRINDHRFPGGHFYLMIFGHLRSGRWFKRASDAEAYGQRVIVRWRRLYDAAIAAMIQKELG